MDFISTILGWIESAYDLLTPCVIIREWEGAIKLRFGKFKKVLEPGLAWKIPLVDEIHTCSIAAETISTKSQSLMTKDNVSIFVSGAVKCRVIDPEAYLIKVKDVDNAIGDISQGAIKRVVTESTFEECRGYEIDGKVKAKLNSEAAKWGVKIESVIIGTLDRGRTIRLIQS